MRLGLFGGSFDPVHYGHLLLAECCREQCQLDEVWFLPAATPPHKQGRALTSGEQRIEMLELAIGGHEAFDVCRLEIERGGISYTVDTLAELARRIPRDSFSSCWVPIPWTICRAGASRRASANWPYRSSLAGPVSRPPTTTCWRRWSRRIVCKKSADITSKCLRSG